MSVTTTEMLLGTTVTETRETGIVPSFLELEITGFCQLKCIHCYAESGPHGGRGTMTPGDWESVIDQAALVRITPELWELFSQPGMFLGTSWYSADPTMHSQITGSKASYARTRANIAEAIRRGIPVRAAIVDILPGQDTEQAAAELRRLGVTDIRIRPSQGIGRGAHGGPGQEVTELCGNCGLDRAAIMPDGQLVPCAIGRWLDCGSVRDTPLVGLLSGPAWQPYPYPRAPPRQPQRLRASGQLPARQRRQRLPARLVPVTRGLGTPRSTAGRRSHRPDVTVAPAGGLRPQARVRPPLVGLGGPRRLDGARRPNRRTAVGGGGWT